MPIRATTDQPSYIDPTRMYAIRRFIADSGISATRIRQADRQGIELRKIKTGKRVFVRGSDGIAFIEQLAELQRQAEQNAE